MSKPRVPPRARGPARDREGLSPFPKLSTGSDSEPGADKTQESETAKANLGTAAGPRPHHLPEILQGCAPPGLPELQQPLFSPVLPLV